MVTSLLLSFTKLLLPLLFAVALIDWLTASPERKVRVLRAAGHTQKAIAERLGISVYRVRKCLA